MIGALNEPNLPGWASCLNLMYFIKSNSASASCAKAEFSLRFRLRNLRVNRIIQLLDYKELLQDHNSFQNLHIALDIIVVALETTLIIKIRIASWVGNCCGHDENEKQSTVEHVYCQELDKRRTQQQTPLTRTFGSMFVLCSNEVVVQNCSALEVRIESSIYTGFVIDSK